MKAIVIGAGILGSTVAFQLAQRGVDTTIIDGNIPGEAASAASLAWTNSNNKKLRPYHDLSTMSIMEWSLLARELGTSAWLRPVGNLHISDSTTGAEMLKDRVERLNSYGYAAIPYPTSRLDRLDPCIRLKDEYTYAAFFPFEGFISTHLLISDLLAASRSLGARANFGRRVTGLAVKGSQVCGIVLEDGERIEADIVIAAAGAGLESLLSHHGVDVRTAGSPGVSLTTSPGASALSTVLHLPKLSARPDSDGRLLVRSKRTDQQIDLSRSELPESAIKELMLLVGEHLDDFDPRLVTAERIKIAARPYLFDGLPVVGHWDGLDGLYVTTMHSGVTLAAIVSRLAAEEITTGTPSSLLEDFRPQRVIDAAKLGVGYFDPYALEGETSK